jgi:hypothetical protein
MSTRTSLALVGDDNTQTVMHLYREMHDDEVHLELKIDQTNCLVNVVIPEVMVPGIQALLERAYIQRHPR